MRILVLLTVASVSMAGCTSISEGTPEDPRAALIHHQVPVEHEDRARFQDASTAGLVGWGSLQTVWHTADILDNQTVSGGSVVLTGNSQSPLGDPYTIHFEVGCRFHGEPCQGPRTLAQVESVLPLEVNMSLGWSPGQRPEFRYWIVDEPDHNELDWIGSGGRVNLEGVLDVVEDPNLITDPWTEHQVTIDLEGTWGACITPNNPTCLNSIPWYESIPMANAQVVAADLTLSWDGIPGIYGEFDFNLACGAGLFDRSCPYYEQVRMQGPSPLRLVADVSEWTFGRGVTLEVREPLLVGLNPVPQDFHIEGTLDFLVPPGQSAGPDRGERS